MKTAILLIGNIRTWDYCKSNFIETFGKYNPDIFLVIDNYRYGHHPAIQSRIGDSGDEHIDDNYVLKMFEDLNLRNFSITPRVSEKYAKVCANFHNMESTFSQIEKMKLATSMLIDEYDCVIKTRCDLMYEQLNLSDKDFSNSVLIDSGNVYPNDCIVITNKTNITEIANFMYQEMFLQSYNDSHLNPPHGILNAAIKDLGLNVVSEKLMNCAVRKGNKKEYY